MKHPFDYHRPMPCCRERSVAITKLEEVSMWANKGSVMQPEEAPVA